MSARPLDLVIIGNGAAGVEAALAIREAGFMGDLDLFADNRHPPYNPMLGTYYASGAIPSRRCFPYGGAEFYDRHGIRAHLAMRVQQLDPGEMSFTTAAGERHTYRKCLVASGAATVFPSVPGLSPPAVLGLRSFDDAGKLRQAAESAAALAATGSRRARALVVGASFAGISVATLLLRAGMEVVLVEREEMILPLAAHLVCARAIERHFRELGLALRLRTSVAAVEDEGSRLRVRLRSESGEGRRVRKAREEELDLVIVCAGSRPSLDFVNKGEVALETGLVVDEHMRTSAADLFAAGDVAQAPDPVNGGHKVVPLWSNARRQGRVAGLNMVGVHAEYVAGVPCNVQHVGGLLFASGGSLDGCDTFDVTSTRRGLRVLAYRSGRLAGFNLLGDVRLSGPLVRTLARDAGLRDDDPAEGWTRGITWTRVNAS